ncbi:MAG: tetratricopeptide repeat protein [Desulfatitalea sp.]|nr:tetratricopeptide repeat protein [Desulfatitalea sp.]NNK02186.1 tetratricopeptide repeat protein [Desulfatitalea sp.]
MKRMFRWMITAMIILGPAAVDVGASEPARLFLSGVEAYQAGAYETAIKAFEAVAAGGVANGELFYNLGNAHLKNGNLGPAILWYERALRLIPDDPDLRFNLSHARSLTKDATEESTAPIVRILFFWKYQLSRRTVIIAAIACTLLCWGLLGARIITRRRGFAQAAVWAMLPALIFSLTAAYNFYEAGRIHRAIVLPERTAVRSGLTKSTTQLFVLHAGAKVTIVKQMRDHYQIRFSADKIGWVEKSALGVIAFEKRLFFGYSS